MIANTAAILAAGNRITELEAQVVSGFYEERVPTFQQGIPTHELQSIVTAEEVTGYVAKIESILKQMGDYIAEVTELRAKLEKARDALEIAHNGITWYIEDSKDSNECDNEALQQIDEALALLSSDNVIASIKAEAFREAAEVCEGSRPCRKEDFPDHWKIYEEVWGPWDSALVRTSTELRRMADELLQEKQNG